MGVSGVRGLIIWKVLHQPFWLAISITVFLAVALHLKCELYHTDISNAFQNTPAEPNARGQCLQLRIFPEYLNWYRARFPNDHEKLLHCSQKGPQDLAFDMFVHGRTLCGNGDNTLAEDIILNKLRLTPNCLDTSCIYQDLVNNALMIMARATGDILTATPSVKHTDLLWMYSKGTGKFMIWVL